MRHDIVHRREQGYCSFPGLALTPDGTLVCVFRAAGRLTYDAALEGRHAHQDPDSAILFTTRGPGETVWTVPRVVVEGGELAPSDPAITILSDGRWLVRHARWQMVESSRRTDLRGPLMRHYVRRGLVGTLAGNGFSVSADAGRNWTTLPSTVKDEDWATAVSRDAVLEQPDGSWLLPVYAGYPAGAECAAVLRSFDQGATWGDASPVAGALWLRLPYRGAASYNETAVARLDDLNLVALVRADTAFVTDGGTFISEGGVGELLWTVSFDGGLTWEPPRPTGLWGQPAHVLVLQDGRLLCTFGHRRAPFGVQAALCRLAGEQFEIQARIVLRDDAAGWDCGYPASVLMPSGEVVSAYYIHGADGVRHVAATTWRLDEMESLQP